MGDLYPVFIFIVCFLLGSVPWGLIISKVFFRTDIREHGSGNIGTTNAMRSLGKIGGGIVFLLDFGKGVLSGVLGVAICVAATTSGALDFSNLAFVVSADFGRAVTGSITDPVLQSAVATAFAGCTLGHIFSPWLRFKGGKGIAVAIGCLLFTYGYLAFIIELALFIVLVLLTRRVSVGSIAAAVVCPFIGLWTFWDNLYAIIVCTIVAVVIIWAHRANIKRLLAGTESKIGDKKK